MEEKNCRKTAWQFLEAQEPGAQEGGSRDEGKGKAR
jgi:hypothetical protein